MGLKEEGARSLIKQPSAKVGGSCFRKERVAASNPIDMPKISEIKLYEYTNPGCSAAWADLPAEILELIIKMDGHSISTVIVFSQVCSSWRISLTSRYGFWNCLRFGTLSVKAMEPAKEFPWILKKAVEAGNLYAIVALARFMETNGCYRNAFEMWFRASKLGHWEGQWKIGLASYYGSMGIAKDTERAYQLFGRIAKGLLELVDRLPQPSVETKDLAALDLPPLMEFQSCTDILRECTHILGILHLDGIATEQDLSTAIRWLRIARKYGSEDAGKLLQSMFRSGMY